MSYDIFALLSYGWWVVVHIAIMFELDLSPLLGYVAFEKILCPIMSSPWAACQSVLSISYGSIVVKN